MLGLAVSSAAEGIVDRLIMGEEINLFDIGMDMALGMISGGILDNLSRQTKNIGSNLFVETPNFKNVPPRPGDDDFVGPLIKLDHHFIFGEGSGAKQRGVLGAVRAPDILEIKN